MDRNESHIEVSDAELVVRAQQGDPAAFGALVRRHQDRVFNAVLRMCRNHADALDVTQTAFLKAFEALPRFAARASFYTWLYRIAINQVLTQRRTDARRPTLSLSAADDERGDFEPESTSDDDPGKRSEDEEMHRRLAEALPRIDEEFRVAVVLKDIEDFDYATISEILQVPVGTVKSRIHRGRMMLRELLTREESRRETL